MPRYFARRNHPRCICQPQSALYYGANNDTQRMLTNAAFKDTLQELGSHEEYLRYQRNLYSIGKGGLEQYNAERIIERYMTSYQCKGGQSSSEWKQTQKTITNEYCKRDGSQNKRIRSLISKHMVQITGGESFTRDQAQFQLGGGVLTMTDIRGSILKCSVSTVPADQLGEKESSMSFNWINVLRRYKGRGINLAEVNLYKYVAKY